MNHPHDLISDISRKNDSKNIASKHVDRVSPLQEQREVFDTVCCIWFRVLWVLPRSLLTKTALLVTVDFAYHGCCLRDT